MTLHRFYTRPHLDYATATVLLALVVLINTMSACIAKKITGENISVRANRSLMYEMFYNLIDNAIKYNKTGGLVNINIIDSGNEIKVTVSDTGIGIPKEAQRRVFERFYRVDKSRSKKTGGTGLGLAIVKHIVMVHSGKIELKSRVNEGTTITVTFGDTL